MSQILPAPISKKTLALPWALAFFSLALTSSLTSAQSSKIESIHASISTSWGPPFLITNTQGYILGGIIPELLEAISREGRFTITPVFLPRYRLDEFSANGSVDLRCFVAKQWVPDASKLEWSGPLFSLNSGIVHRPSARLYEPSFPKNIGAGRGYFYDQKSALLFAQKQWLREDSPDNNSLLTKFYLGRLDGALVDEISYTWHMLQHPSSLRPAMFEPIATVDIECSIPEASRADRKKIFLAINKAIDSGAVKTIMDKYR